MDYIKPQPNRLMGAAGGDCPLCGSTTLGKKWIFFGEELGCIQPECNNYHENPKSHREGAIQAQREWIQKCNQETRERNLRNPYHKQALLKEYEGFSIIFTAKKVGNMFVKLLGIEKIVLNKRR